MGVEVVNGIVLSVQHYGERGMVVQLYTREYGRIGAISYASKAQDGAKLSSFFRTLAVLKIRIQLGRHAGNMPRLLAVEDWAHQTLHSSNYEKVLAAAFIAELLQRLLIEPTPNEEIYQFLLARIALFAADAPDVGAFLMLFLIDLAILLGFEPQGRYSAAAPYFSLSTGIFSSDLDPNPADAVRPSDAIVWSQMLIDSYQSNLQSVNRTQRFRILQQELRYLQIHSGLRLELKSFAVLKELLMA